MIRQLIRFCLIVGSFMAYASLGHAQIVGKDTVLVADISEDNVGITTTFHGTHLLLFGNTHLFGRNRNLDWLTLGTYRVGHPLITSVSTFI